MKARFAIIGGTGFERLGKNAKRIGVKTPYGIVSSVYLVKMADKLVAVLLRHGLTHSTPPHKINYRANVYALHKLGVSRVIATNAVGGINPNFNVGDIVVPDDFVDFTKFRATTFYDEAPVAHIDVSQPYCSQIRKLLIMSTKKRGLRVWNRATMVCTEGPRYETPSEIRIFSHLGCDVVGMTGFPEVVLARELEMCYASVCYVSNKAAGLQQRLTANEVAEMSKRILPSLEEVLIETIRALPNNREDKCSCANALKTARLE